MQQPYVRHSRWFEKNVGDKLREAGISIDPGDDSSRESVDLWAEAVALLENLMI